VSLNSKLPLVSAAVILAPLASSAAWQSKQMTLEQASGRADGPSYRPTSVSWRWAEDGRQLRRASGDDARLVDITTWAESAPTDSPEPKPKDEERADGQAYAAFIELGLDEKTAKRLAGRASGEGTSLVSNKGVLYAYRAGAAVRIPSQANVELEELAPDGQRLAWVEANDLMLFDLEGSRLTPVTTDGDSETFNGKLDWVYQEEVYGRGNFKAFWWSPSSSHVAFLRLDESEVYEFTLVDHIEDGTFRVKPEVTNYPKAGDPNPTTMLGIASVDDGAVLWVDLSRYDGTEPLVVRVGWTPDGALALYQVQDRIQTWLELVAVDPETGEQATWIREESESWVDVEGMPTFLEDGSFLWRSSRTGYRHLYHYSADGSLLRAVTSGDWRVNRVRHIDEERGLVWFSGTKDGAIDSNEYRVGLDGRGLRRLTSGRGYHSLSWNSERTHFIDRVSSLEDEGETRLCDADGKIIKLLAEAELAGLDGYASSRWEVHEVPTRDGILLDAAILRPVPFDAEQAHPVWISTYSGPDAPSVRNRWNSSSWYQFLAQNGICVMQVNVRSASGRGSVATATAYKQLGVQELRDLEDAVDWLTANPWADASRVGITGYSYGGFMAAFALTHSKKFALGIAGGGVYDWGMYDTIYTERYMSTPQLNKEGYEQTSVLNAVEDLSGWLVLHAGAMDDNVHMQNTLQLAYRLQRAGKQFDMMIYPQARHGIRDRGQRWHSRVMEWNAIREHLVSASPATPVDPADSAETASPLE